MAQRLTPLQKTTLFPINRRHQGLATGYTYGKYPEYWGIGFPINRRHQGLATPAPRAVAAQGHPKVFARSPILGLQTPVVYPVENLEILCSAVERAAPRGIGVSASASAARSDEAVLPFR